MGSIVRPQELTRSIPNQTSARSASRPATPILLVDNAETPNIDARRRPPHPHDAYHGRRSPSCSSRAAEEVPTPGDVGGSLAVSSWSKWQPSSLVEKASWRQGYMRVSTIVDRKESNGKGAGLKFMRREMKRKIFVYALIFYLVHLDTIEGWVGQVQCGNGSQLAARPVFMFNDLNLE